MTPEQIWAAAGPAERRLAGLALNPAAPVDVLLRLLADGSDAVRMVLCRDRVLPGPVVDAAVAHPDRDTRSFFARNPYVDPEQRARLVDDPEWFVRAHLASEPRAADVCRPRPLPDRTVVRIIETYEDEWRGGLGRQISPGLRRAMATHPSPAVRRMGAHSWASLAPGVRDALLTDPDQGVRDAAADSRRRYEQLRDPDAVREDLPAHHCHARTHLLMYGALAPDVIAEAWDESPWLIAANASTPAKTVALLAAHPDAEVRARVAERSDLGPAERRALAVDPDPAVRLAVSVHPAWSEAERAAIDYEVPQEEWYGHLPVYDPEALPGPEQTRDLALSAHPLLRRRAACVPTLPAGLVARLADDTDLGVRVLLGQNHPDAPAALLLRCFLEYTGRDRWHLTGHGNFPRTGLARFADDDDPAVRRLALLDAGMPADTADRLTRDPDPQVRADAARHPRLPQDRIAALLDDPELAHRAAANPALPLATMDRLVATAGRERSGPVP
ncbi:hypothetical protein ABZ454_06570 [Streptomyces sp. NPDC005803]|uniref:hypothetical protein n=1 Tax=Streptomyces sp. NPDC005803 TaxID=3154297 RepID=UPI003404C2F4